MCSLHGPYTLPQPIDQREIVSSAAKECLAKMNVSLNKARNDGAISGIDYGIGSVTCTTKLGDASIGYENVAPHDGIARVHRHHCAVFYED